MQETSNEWSYRKINAFCDYVDPDCLLVNLIVPKLIGTHYEFGFLMTKGRGIDLNLCLIQTGCLDSKL